MQYRQLTELTKLANNPRTISIEDMERLQASIKKFGVLEGRPLILSNRTGELVIIGGNMRYEACKKLGIKEVPTQLMEGLSEEDEQEIIIRDNVSNGAWDMDALANEWNCQLLDLWGVKVEPIVTKDEEKEMKEDKVPEEPKAIYVQEGDVFQLGNHRLMCGDSMNEDCIKELIKGKNTNKTHCISDPPYGIAYNPDKHGMIKNDDKILDYTELGKKYSDGFFCMWTGYQVVDKWMGIVKNTFDKITNLIIWHKGGGGMGDCARTLSQDYEVLIVSNRGNEIHGHRGSATWMWNTEEKEEFMKRASKDMLKQVLTEISKGQCIWKVGKDDTSSYMHPCLPAGEKVFINGSWINIEDVRLGQESQYGIIESISTHDAEEIVEIEVEGNLTRSTGNHPFLVERDNQILWLEARLIIEGDKILANYNILNTLKPQGKNDHQVNILPENDIQQLSDITGSTIENKNDTDLHTMLSGSHTTDQSQSECKSTTSMKTSRIIELRISSLSVPLTTKGNTLIAFLSKENGKSCVKYAEDIYSSTTQTGTTPEDGSLEKSVDNAQSQNPVRGERFVSRMVGSVKTTQEKTKVYNLSIKGTPAFDTLVGVSHNTQKPVEINQRVLENFTSEGDNVIDLFGGSGSNLITCEKTNRVCYMMELDPKYIQVIIKRYAEYTDLDSPIMCLNRDLDMDLIINQE